MSMQSLRPAPATPATPPAPSSPAGQSSTELAVLDDTCQAWAMRTQSDVNSALALKREASTQMTRNASIALDKKFAQSVQMHLKGKMADTTALTNALQEKTRDVESMVRQLYESFGKVQQAHSSKWKALCVVSRRLEIRDRRPDEERGNDQFQMDAETERQVLLDSRQQLAEAARITKEQMQPLYAIKQEMQEDLLEKRRSYRIDHLCLLDGGHRGDLSSEDVSCAPRLREVMSIEPSSPQNAEPGTGTTNDQIWKSQTQGLLTKAELVLEEGKVRIDANNHLMQVTEVSCKKGAQRTLKSMNESVTTLTAQKKALESEIQDVDKMIGSAAISLEKTGRRLKQHEAPLQTLRRQFLLRQQRTEREHIRDPVHEGLESHLSATKKTVQTLSTQADGTAGVVEELKATKQRLQEALRLKTIALRLDVSCTKATQTNVAALFMNPQSPRIASQEVSSPSRLAAKANAGGTSSAVRATSADAAAGANSPPHTARSGTHSPPHSPSHAVRLLGGGGTRSQSVEPSQFSSS